MIEKLPSMVQHEYQFPFEVEAPYVTCLVPEEWRTRELPVMGGAVEYRSKQGDVGGDYVFEFSVPHGHRNANCLCVLRIARAPDAQLMAKLADREIPINCRVRRRSREAPAEVILLHHVFCLFAGSALTGESWVDIADVAHWLSGQSELSLNYGRATKPMQFRKLRARLTRSAGNGGYVVLMGRMGSVKMATLEELQRMFRTNMVYAPAGTGGGALISALTP